MAIVGRNKNALKDILVNIDSKARKRGLWINENKTRYVAVTSAASNSDHLRCEKYEFEHVKQFNYLGSQLNQTNSTSSEIQARILSGNRSYYAYGKLTLWRWNFLLILAHPVFKMWIIQEPKKLALWNKRHFEEKKTEIMQHV